MHEHVGNGIEWNGKVYGPVNCAMQIVLQSKNKQAKETLGFHFSWVKLNRIFKPAEEGKLIGEKKKVYVLFEILCFSFR